jgi:hypothetical protein
MLKPLSNLTLDTRIEVIASPGLLASGVTGTWAKLTTPAVDGSMPTADLPTAGGFAFPVWSESYRDKTAGKWSPDVAATGQLTLIYGKYRAVTDQVDVNNLPAVGDALYVNAAGKLTTVNTGKGIVVAQCSKAAHDTYYLSTKFTNCIEFITV